jgi:hypothetical protein|tara:strand:+ start:85 stop:585 length:501 start_codon:yes stop_codon:yes gene_type:complete
VTVVLLSAGLDAVILAALKQDGVHLPTSSHLLTNRLIFDDDGYCVAVEPSSPPASREGKLFLLAALDVLRDKDLVLMVGDKPVDARVARGMPPLRAAAGSARSTLSFGFHNAPQPHAEQPGLATTCLDEYRATFDILATKGNECSFAPLVALVQAVIQPPLRFKHD